MELIERTLYLGLPQCVQFGCGKELTRLEYLYGNKCLKCVKTNYKWNLISRLENPALIKNGKIKK